MPRRFASALVTAALSCLLAGCALVPVPGATGSERLPTPGVTAATETAPPVREPGTAVASGRWQWTVSSVDWDRTAAVHEANPHAHAPVEGYGWAVLRLTAENMSAESASPSLFDVTLVASGWSVAHRALSESPVRLPDAFVPRTVQPGENVSGDLGFWMPLRAQADPGCRVHLSVRHTVTGAPEDFVFACTAAPALRG